jgi:hypothetical protein
VSQPSRWVFAPLGANPGEPRRGEFAHNRGEIEARSSLPRSSELMELESESAREMRRGRFRVSGPYATQPEDEAWQTQSPRAHSPTISPGSRAGSASSSSTSATSRDELRDLRDGTMQRLRNLEVASKADEEKVPRAFEAAVRAYRKALR